MPSQKEGRSEKIDWTAYRIMTDYPKNQINTYPSDNHNFSGSLPELEMILREDFGLELKKDDVRNISISLTGYVDTLLEISKG